VVDDRLRDERGHQLGFVQGLAAFFSGRGARVEVWAHRRFAPTLEVPGARLERRFALGWDEAFSRARAWSRPGAILAHNFRFLRQLLRAGRRDWDLVIATEANILHLLAWRLWLAWAPRDARLLLVFVYPPWLFDYDPRDGAARPKRQAFLYRWALRSMGGSLRSGRCRLAADAEVVADFLGDGGRWRVGRVVVPIAPASLARLDAPPPAPRGGLRLGVLGRPVRERGFDRLLAAVRLWCQGARERDRGRAVRFVIQWHADREAQEDDRLALQELARAYPETIEVMEGSFDTAAYAAHLVSLHGAILPYSRRAYAQRASNVVMELLCAGRPFFATADTWLAREQQARGAGVLGGEAPEEIVAGIEALVADYDALARQAWGRREEARAHYGWPRFFSAVGLAMPPRATEAGAGAKG
jgi:glycosyltransferase involved in cell wall biosynthesis